MDPPNIWQYKTSCRYAEENDVSLARDFSGLYDAVWIAPHHGLQPSLWSGTVVSHRIARRLEPDVLPSCRFRWNWFRPHTDRQQCTRAICTACASTFSKPQYVPRGLLALVSSCTVALQDAVRPHAVGRT